MLVSHEYQTDRTRSDDPTEGTAHICATNVGYRVPMTLIARIQHHGVRLYRPGLPFDRPEADAQIIKI